ncbi:Major facilitator superfamily domain, general substrate transporter [Lasallia pustulata]|uniref:Major facilitator superfamily domain, general substrate transporter n=1 Tax=Lasallia pustulata TaxID=136370 RepID=A0A1W5DDS5_9LECA|nr:Major facilitator superfamily domain, general substrate transporter [Lasallia pustulata]
MGALAPETLLLSSGGQWTSARRSRADMNSLGFKHWTMAHGFYADSGGFVLQTPDFHPFPVSAKQVWYLVKENYITVPDLTEKEIFDKSKADLFTKTVACLQAAWFLTQCLARAIQHLSLTPLELATGAILLCTSTTYYFWLRKPLNVQTPTVLTTSHSISQILLRGGEAAEKPYWNTPLDFAEPRVYTFDQWPTLSSLCGPHNKPLDRVPNDRNPETLTFREWVGYGSLLILFSTSSFLAWHFQFPTEKERLIWRTACIVAEASLFVHAIVEAIAHWRNWHGIFYVGGYKATSDPPAPSEEHGLAKSGAHTEHGARDRVLEIAPNDGSNDEKTVAGVANEENIDEEEKEDKTVYPGGAALAVLTSGLCMALRGGFRQHNHCNRNPPNHHRLHSLNDVGWYGSSYLLTTCSLQPSFGKIYTHFDVKWTYLVALLIFELGSIICAAAKNSVMLIVGRAVAGAGAAALFSGGMTINLPFGGIALLTVFFFIKNPERKHGNMTFKEKIKQVDLLGAFFLICAIVCLLLALQWGGSLYPWHYSRVWGCLLGFGSLISIFIALLFRLGDRATILPRILSQRTLCASSAFCCILAMGLYTHIFYLPFYFQAVKGTMAEGSGIRSIPYLISVTIAFIAIGDSITAFGWYTPFMWFGTVVFTNLPFGGIALLTVFFFFKNPERKHGNMTFKEKIKQVDLLGAFYLIYAIVCLLLALQWGGSSHRL